MFADDPGLCSGAFTIAVFINSIFLVIGRIQQGSEASGKKRGRLENKISFN